MEPPMRTRYFERVSRKVSEPTGPFPLVLISDLSSKNKRHVSGLYSAATREPRPLLWRELTKSVPGRTKKDCRRRWCNILADGTAKGSWTESEDGRLSNAVQENGPKWTRVAAAVGTRNSDQCSSH